MRGEKAAAREQNQQQQRSLPPVIAMAEQDHQQQNDACRRRQVTPARKSHRQPRQHRQRGVTQQDARHDIHLPDQKIRQRQRQQQRQKTRQVVRGNKRPRSPADVGGNLVPDLIRVMRHLCHRVTRAKRAGGDERGGDE